MALRPINLYFSSSAFPFLQTFSAARKPSVFPTGAYTWLLISTAVDYAATKDTWAYMPKALLGPTRM